MDVEHFYEEYCRTVDAEYSSMADKVRECKDRETATRMALELAVTVYASMLACKELIAYIDEAAGKADGADKSEK